MASSASCGYPLWVDGGTYPGELARFQHVSASFLNVSNGQVMGGVLPSGGQLKVAAASGMNVSVAMGYVLCPSSAGSVYGGYLFGLSSAATLSVATSDPTNPRIDMVVAYVYDDGESDSSAYVEVLTGTPTAGATLTNLNGAPVAPANSVILAYVLVPAASTSVSSGNVSNTTTKTVAQGGILPVTLGDQPAGFTGMYMHDYTSGRLMHNPLGGPVQPVLLPFTPQNSGVVSPPLFEGSTITLCSVSVTVDGNTDLEIIASCEGVSQANTADNSRLTYWLYIGSTLVKTVYQGAPYLAVSSGGVGFTHFTAAGQDRPAAGTHTVALKYFDSAGTHTYPTTVFGAEIYVRPCPL